MKTLKEIRARLRALADEGERLYGAADKEERELTDEESKRIEAIQSELDELEAEEKRLVNREGFESRARGLRETGRPLESPIDDDDDDGAVEDRTQYTAWPEEHAADFVRCIIAHYQRRSLPGDMHPELREAFSGALEHRAPTGASTYFDAEGGFLVPRTISSTILRHMFSEGGLLGRTQQVPISVGKTASWNALTESSRASGSRYGGIVVNRTPEAGAASKSKPAFQQVHLELKKQTALVYLTEEQIEDGPQLMTFVNELVPRAITFETESEIINGSGGSNMRGILNSSALVTVTKETGQAAATILFENIINMWARMIASSRSSAAWFINQDIEPQLFTMSMAVGTGGVPVYMPANNISGSPFGTLMGRPVIPIEHCATLGTVGDIILADLSQYLYAFKGAIRTAQSMHVKFEEGETAFRFVNRNDGKSWWPSALTPANGSNTLSPFVALETRS